MDEFEEGALHALETIKKEMDKHCWQSCKTPQLLKGRFNNAVHEMLMSREVGKNAMEDM